MKKLWLLVALVPTLALAAGFRTGQVSVGTGSASTIGSVLGRVSLAITNADTANPIYCGNASTVTSSTGFKLAAGVGFVLDNVSTASSGQPVASQTVYCISTGGTVVATFLEDYNQ